MAIKDSTPQIECSKCHVALPATTEYFYKKARGKYGLFAHCKECHCAMTRPNAKQWNKDHPEKNAAFQRKYKQNHPSAHKLRQHLRRNSKSAIDGNLATAADIVNLLKSQNNRCWYCQCELNDNYHIDHFIPISKGGAFSAGNLRIACQPCNSHKHNILPWKWNGRLI